MINFQHIEYLYALILVLPIGLLLYGHLQWKKRMQKKIGDPRLVAELTRHYSSTTFRTQFILLIIAFAIGIVALANPRIRKGNTNITRNGIDVIFAIDVSKSMLAQDVKPDRISRARQCMVKLMEELGEDRIGIVVFAGKAYLQMPLTNDHAAAKMYLSTVSPDVVPTQGTVIGDALKMSYSAFNSIEKKYKAIVLISDGEDHDEQAEKVAKDLADAGVMVCSIGMGSVGGSNILDPAGNGLKRDADGNPVVTKLNETTLQNIAVASKGIYHHYDDTEATVDAITKQLNSIGSKTITDQSFVSYIPLFPWLLGVLLLLLVIELLMSNTKSEKRILVNKKAVSTAALIFGIFSHGFAQLPAPTVKQLIVQGNKAFQEKQYPQAIQAYEGAIKAEPGNAVAQFNLGNAYRKAGQTEAAIKAWDASIMATKNPTEQAAAWYNKGVVLQEKKQWNECIAAYKNALKLNSADQEARLNLQKALKELNKKKQEQQQQPPPPKQQQQPKPQQQNQQPPKPQPAPNKMTPKEAEEKLKALLQQEKNLQEKFRKVQEASVSKPAKDW